MSDPYDDVPPTSRPAGGAPAIPRPAGVLPPPSEIPTAPQPVVPPEVPLASSPARAPSTPSAVPPTSPPVIPSAAPPGVPLAEPATDEGTAPTTIIRSRRERRLQEATTGKHAAITPRRTPSMATTGLGVMAGTVAVLMVAFGIAYVTLRPGDADASAKGATPPAPSASPSSSSPASEPPSPSAPASPSPTPSPTASPTTTSALPPAERAAADELDRIAQRSAPMVSGTWVVTLFTMYDGIEDPYMATRAGSHRWRPTDILWLYQKRQNELGLKGAALLRWQGPQGPVWSMVADGGFTDLNAVKAWCSQTFAMHGTYDDPAVRDRCAAAKMP
ncbi:hypothetical protein KEM60_01100 [Austwickia sp. TVS 96-490-7B]|uniref:hypothetical protein n=1 Tax=Austwickia sp. TVS 96-490-7B TaxID=2830843 RepID=UPI001C56FB97|nr:hypothetical protein [Austwickia sp. TVS 96-490-7B]MBW3084910.1 hypothetical protein [Austwickia sp. TVS 96-490-7B]